MLRTRPGNPYYIHFLKGIVPDERRGNLPCQNNHGNGIGIGRGDARDCIGGTGAGSGKTNPHLSRSARVPIGGMHSALLMPHQNMSQLRMAGQFVINIDDGSAGIAEEKVYAFTLQTLQKDGGPGAQHSYFPSCSL